MEDWSIDRRILTNFVPSAYYSLTDDASLDASKRGCSFLSGGANSCTRRQDPYATHVKAVTSLGTIFHVDVDVSENEEQSYVLYW
jgi:hypothetical protein